MVVVRQASGMYSRKLSTMYVPGQYARGGLKMARALHLPQSKNTHTYSQKLTLHSPSHSTRHTHHMPHVHSRHVHRPMPSHFQGITGPLELGQGGDAALAAGRAPG